MQNRFGLLDTDVMPICIIIALDIFIIIRFSINCSTVICSPTVILAIMREASSETYGPRVYFPSYTFRSKTKNTKNTLLHYFYFCFTFRSSNLFYLSLSDLILASNREGIDNPFIALGASV